MKPVEPTHTRALIALCYAAISTGALIVAGCHKSPSVSLPPAAPAAPAVPGPEPFMGELTEVDGVQAILSIRHPAQVNEDLKKLMAAVPEASLLRLALFRLSPFGYPGFSEVAPGSNVGAVILRVSAEDYRWKSVGIVGFAKIADGGKLSELIEQGHLAHLKHGDWVMFAKSYADLLRLGPPDGVIAYLEKPQADDVRFWGRVSPELLAGFKGAIARAVKLGLAQQSMERRKAFLGYLGAAYSLASQVHSIGLSLNLTDDALKLVFDFQFLPDSPIGIYLRYTPGPAPAVAQYVSANSLVTFAGRPNVVALAGLANSLMDSVIRVDYPPAAAQLKEFKDAYLACLSASDGGLVGTVDMAPGTQDGRTGPQKETFLVMPSHFTREVARRYTHGIQGAVMKAMLASKMPVAMASPASVQPVVNFDFRYACHQDAATVDGIPFDVSYVSRLENGREISRKAQYVGVVGGDLVMADSEKSLRDHVPALIAKVPLADGIRAPLDGKEQAWVVFNEGKIVDLVVSGARLNMADADAKAAVDSLKAEFVAAGPVTAAGSAGQARMTLTISVPYKSVESGVHFAQWAGAQNINVFALLAGAANPAAPAPQPAIDPDQPMPEPLSQ